MVYQHLLLFCISFSRRIRKIYFHFYISIQTTCFRKILTQFCMFKFYFCLVFWSSLSLHCTSTNIFQVPAIYSPLRSSIAYVHGDVSLTFLIRTTSSVLFCVYRIRNWSLTLNLGFFYIRYTTKTNTCFWLNISRPYFDWHMSSISVLFYWLWKFTYIYIFW